jgi:hypothetical protein
MKCESKHEDQRTGKNEKVQFCAKGGQIKAVYTGGSKYQHIAGGGGCDLEKGGVGQASLIQ